MPSMHFNSSNEKNSTYTVRKQIKSNQAICAHRP